MFPYICEMCRYQFHARLREVPLQVIQEGEAATSTIQIAASWGLL